MIVAQGSGLAEEERPVFIAVQVLQRPFFPAPGHQGKKPVLRDFPVEFPQDIDKGFRTGQVVPGKARPVDPSGRGGHVFQVGP